jgi:hypothetical protein
MTYFVAFTFLTFENDENLTWILQMLLDLLSSKDNMSKVIVTDKDITLTVVAIVSLKTIVLVCQFHIARIVRAKCITIILVCQFHIARIVTAKCITYSIVKSKCVKIDENDKEVKEVKSSE